MSVTVTNTTSQAIEVQYSTTWAALYGLTPQNWYDFIGDDAQNGGNGGSLVIQPGQAVALPGALPKSALPAVLS